MSDRLLFISDLHLQTSRPELTRGLLDFLGRESGRCQALYILGDLFEVWLGDDAADALAQEVATALRDFVAAGSQVYLMHGNRDFLLGAAYAQSAGAELLPDPVVISTPIGEVLLAHGDSLCTDDVDYQQFRAQVRNPAWQTAFLAKSVPERIEFARQAREQSKEATADKAMAIMDVNQQAVVELMSAHQQSRLIHGHTHRPDEHALTVDGNSAWRLVLGDWGKQGWVAEISDAGVNLSSFDL